MNKNRKFKISNEAFEVEDVVTAHVTAALTVSYKMQKSFRLIFFRVQNPGLRIFLYRFKKDAYSWTEINKNGIWAICRVRTVNFFLKKKSWLNYFFIGSEVGFRGQRIHC